MTFHSLDIFKGTPPTYVGVENYVDILVNEPALPVTVANTLIYAGVTVVLQFLIGLGFALLLNREMPAGRIVRTFMLLPYITMPVVTALIWKLLMNPTAGLINMLLAEIGIRGINWIGDTSIVMLSVIIAKVWRDTPFATLVLLAALQTLPPEPFEAAQIDGASRIQIFRHLTLPLLRPAIAVVLLFQIIFGLRGFDIIWVLTGGGPGYSSTVLSIFIYKYLFNFWKLGGAAVLAFILFLITFLVSLVLFRMLYREMEV